jgi:hypothetical protein
MNGKLLQGTVIKIAFTVALVSVLFIVSQFEFPASFEKSSNIMTILATGVYAWLIGSSPSRIDEKINLYRVFILLTIPFYFGGQILILLGYSERLGMERYSLIDGRISTAISVDAMQYILLALLFFHIGYLLNEPNLYENMKRSINYNEKVIRGINLVASVILVVTIGPSIARLLYDLVLARTYGHLAALHIRSEENYMGMWFIFSYIQGWFLPACYMKLIVGKNRILINLLLAIYCILYLMSGSRFQILLILFSVFIIEVYWNNRKINSRAIIKNLLFVWILIIVLRSVSYTRDLTGSGLSFESVMDVIGGGVLYETLFETSTTFTSVANILKYCPEVLPFNYGKSILGSLIYVLPSYIRPSIINEIVLHISSVLSPLYYGFKGAGYGSAFVTEAYYNFGYYAYIALMIFGFAVGALIKKIIHCAKAKDAYMFILSMYIMSELVWGIRADLYLVPRHVVYYILIPLLIARLISVRAENEERNNKWMV